MPLGILTPHNSMSSVGIRPILEIGMQTFFNVAKKTYITVDIYIMMMN